MKVQGKRSKQPLTESFLRYPNNKYVALALFGATAGQGVVWYTGQFYALFFILIYLKLDFLATYGLIGLSLVLGTPFFLLFGWLSDKIGRKWIILAGCLIAALTYFPLFRGLTHYINPALETYQQKTPITVAATDCNFHIFIGPWSRQTECDKVKDFLGKSGLSFASLPSVPGQPPVMTRIGDTEIRGWDEKQFKSVLASTGYPTKADSDAGELGDGRADPRPARHLRHDGLRADRGVPRRAVPRAHPLHVDVAPLPHRERLVRRHAPAARDGDRREAGQHLRRPLVPDHRRADHVRHRRAVPARDAARPHPRGARRRVRRCRDPARPDRAARPARRAPPRRSRGRPPARRRLTGRRAGRAGSPAPSRAARPPARARAGGAPRSRGSRGPRAGPRSRS